MQQQLHQNTIPEHQYGMLFKLMTKTEGHKACHDTIGHGCVMQYQIKSFMKTGYDIPVIICLIEEEVFIFFFFSSDGGIIAFLRRLALD